MSTVLRWALVVAVGILATLPFPESVMALRPEIARRSGSAWLLPLVLAYLVSIIQLVGEYWVAGQAKETLIPRIKRVWAESGFRRFWLGNRPKIVPESPDSVRVLKPLLLAGGYIGMFLCCTNPVPGTPVSRLAAVIAWRTARLRGSLGVILLGSFVRLLILYPAVAGVRGILAP